MIYKCIEFLVYTLVFIVSFMSFSIMFLIFYRFCIAYFSFFKNKKEQFELKKSIDLIIENEEKMKNFEAIRFAYSLLESEFKKQHEILMSRDSKILELEKLIKETK